METTDMKKLAVLFFVLAIALAACGTPATATPEAAATPTFINAVISEGHLVPAQDATLVFQARGTVMEVKVKIGDTVKAGDVLARLGGPNDAAYAAAQAELVGAQQALKSLREAADTMRSKAWIALRDAKVAYEDAKDLYDAMVAGDYTYDRIVYVTMRGMRVPTVETVTVAQVDDVTLADAKADMEPQGRSRCGSTGRADSAPERGPGKYRRVRGHRAVRWDGDGCQRGNRRAGRP
jgi:multidrug efflux pump subunit AcrA (membrane-fusion protein)